MSSYYTMNYYYTMQDLHKKIGADRTTIRHYVATKQLPIEELSISTKRLKVYVSTLTLPELKQLVKKVKSANKKQFTGRPKKTT